MTLEIQFKEWLIKKGYTGAPNSYPKAIFQISKHYSEQTGNDTDIYSLIDQRVISEIAHDYSQHGKYSAFGYEQHGRFRAAIARYSEFIVQHFSSIPLEEAMSPECPTGDENKNIDINNFTYEKDLQTTLCAQISELFPDYQIYGIDLQGIEYTVGGKRIDVLLEHKTNGKLLAVELKSDVADYKVFGQISMYLGLLKEKFPEKEIDGIIIAGSIDPSLKIACTITDRVTLKVYRMSLELEDA